MAGKDTIRAASFIAEIGYISKFPTPSKHAEYAGVALVTDASGMSKKQYADKRGNRETNRGRESVCSQKRYVLLK